MGFSANSSSSSINRYSGSPRTSTTVWQGVDAAASAAGAKAVFGGSYVPRAVAAVKAADVAIVVIR